MAAPSNPLVMAPVMGGVGAPVAGGAGTSMPTILQGTSMFPMATPQQHGQAGRLIIQGGQVQVQPDMFGAGMMPDLGGK